jgi:transcriptional regulator with XRE-family HTH domain
MTVPFLAGYLKLVTLKKQNLIGSRVRTARLKSKPPITQQELVARLQTEGLDYIDQAKVSRIESGSRPVRDYEAVALAAALRVSVSWLLGEKD